jgi:hypothetical protein
MKLPRRQFLRLAAGVVALPSVSRVARADTYPAKPVRLMNGFASTTRTRTIELRRLDSGPRPDTLEGLDTPDTDRVQNVVIFPKK